MSTHQREARSKAIVERRPSVDPAGRVLRVLECDHVVYEPRGGRAKAAQRAHCPVCAPRLAAKTKTPAREKKKSFREVLAKYRRGRP